MIHGNRNREVTRKKKKKEKERLLHGERRKRD